MGRDLSDAIGETEEKLISTHTPAWGATKLSSELSTNEGISTHTPAWGATNTLRKTATIVSISTHTPAWGATTYVYSITLKLKNFNSHARVGRDKILRHWQII